MINVYVLHHTTMRTYTTQCEKTIESHQQWKALQNPIHKQWLLYCFSISINLSNVCYFYLFANIWAIIQQHSLLTAKAAWATTTTLALLLDTPAIVKMMPFNNEISSRVGHTLCVLYTESLAFNLLSGEINGRFKSLHIYSKSKQSFNCNPRDNSCAECVCLLAEGKREDPVIRFVCYL